MNQDNRPPYQMPQMNPGQQPQGQYPNSAQQPSYSMYDQQNAGMDYGRPTNYQPDRSQPNMGMNPAQNYQGYSQPPQAAQPQPPAQSQNMQGYNYSQNVGGAPGYSQINQGPSQQPDRMQNYNSFHETSAPIGGNAGISQYAPKPTDYPAQPERSVGPAAQLFRSDSGLQQNYAASGMPDLRGQNQYSGIGKCTLSSKPNLSAGQSSNQPQPQMYPQPSGIDAGGMHTGSQSFHLGSDMAATGGLPQISIGGGQQMMNMGAVSQNKNDPSNMDISTLNRMAEYYATNSDYPKVMSQFNVFRQSNILKRLLIYEEKMVMPGLH